MPSNNLFLSYSRVFVRRLASSGRSGTLGDVGVGVSTEKITMNLLPPIGSRAMDSPTQHRLVCYYRRALR